MYHENAVLIHMTWHLSYAELEIPGQKAHVGIRTIGVLYLIIEHQQRSAPFIKP